MISIDFGQLVMHALGGYWTLNFTFYLFKGQGGEHTDKSSQSFFFGPVKLLFYLWSSHYPLNQVPGFHIQEARQECASQNRIGSLELQLGGFGNLTLLLILRVLQSYSFIQVWSWVPCLKMKYKGFWA